LNPKTRRYILVAFLAVLALSLVYTMYWASGRPAVGEPQDAPVVVQLPEQARLQHSLLGDYTGQWSWAAVVEPLRWPGLMRPAANWSLETSLAEQFEVLPDGKSVRFGLDPEASWYLGEDIEPVQVTAADVRETWRLLLRLNPELESSVADISISGTDEVVLRLTSADPGVFWRFATIGILPESTIDGVNSRAELDGLELWTTETSAGPCIPVWPDSEEDPPSINGDWTFELRSTQGEGEQVEGSQEEISKLILHFGEPTADDGVAHIVGVGAVPLLDDQEDWLSTVNHLADKGYQGIVTAASRYVSLGLNTERGPLRDSELRRALEAATDRQELIDTVVDGYGTAADSPFPPGSWPIEGLDDSTQTQVDTVQEVLGSAGYADQDGDGYVERPDGEPLDLVVLVPGGTPKLTETAELLIGMWDKVGIRARTEKVESDVYLERVFLDRDFDGFLYVWPVTMDLNPAPVWSTGETRRGGINPVGFISSDIDGLLNTGTSTIIHQTRQEVYQEFANVMRKKLPHLFLFWPGNVAMVHPDLEGVKPSIQGFAWNIHEWSWYHEPSR